MDCKKRTIRKRKYRVILDESTTEKLPKKLQYDNIDQEWQQAIVPIILDYHKTMDLMADSINSIFQFPFFGLICAPCCTY